MHSHSLDQWTHDHVFLGAQHEHNERRTWFVVGLTAAMMIGEITAGSLFGSMALLADGWHMATHAAALHRVCEEHAHRFNIHPATLQIESSGEVCKLAPAERV